MKKTKQVSILIIDDDSIDRRSIKRAFVKQKISNPIVEATNGKEALNILLDNIDKTYLVLLDINMPIMNGHEFLEKLRNDNQLSKTVVFVLTTSDADKDVIKAYEKHVAGYMLKQNVGNEFINKIKMVDLFILSIEFPNDSA